MVDEEQTSLPEDQDEALEVESTRKGDGRVGHYDKTRHLKWTTRQTLFKTYYRQYRSSKVAAEKAGYKSPANLGCGLLAHPEMRAAIDKEDQDELREMGIDPQAVLRELAIIGFADMKDLVTIKGNSVTIKSTSEMGALTKALSEITETTTNQGTTIKIKTHSKLDALKLIATSLGMLVNKTELTGADGGPIDVSELTPEQRKQRIAELLANRGGGTPSTPGDGGEGDPVETSS
jgi:phage terminase small subunit